MILLYLAVAFVIAWLILIAGVHVTAGLVHLLAVVALILFIVWLIRYLTSGPRKLL